MSSPPLHHLDTLYKYSWLDSANDTNDNYKLPLPCLIVSLITSFASIISAVILIFLLVHEARTNLPGITRRLFLYLTVSDFITAVGCFVGLVRYVAIYHIQNEKITESRVCNPSIVCIGQSIFTLFGMLSAVMWTLMIAIFLVIKVSHENEQQSRVFYTAVGFFKASCWGMPAVVVIFSCSMLVFGEENESSSVGWCTIKEAGCRRSVNDTCPIMTANQRLLWILWTGKFWEFTIYLLALVLSGVTYYKLKLWYEQQEWDFNAVEQATGLSNDAVHPMSIGHPPITKEENMFLLLPWILSILRSGGTAHFLIIALKTLAHIKISKDIMSTLFYFNGIGSTSEALCNLLLILYFCPSARNVLCSVGRQDVTPEHNIEDTGHRNDAFIQE